MTHKNGFLPLNLQFFAEPGGEGGVGGDNPAGDDPNGGGTGGEGGEANKPGEQGGNDTAALLAQIEQMKKDMADQKKALDEATKQAAERKRELRAKQTQEEIDAANKKEAEEKREQEFQELQKKVARAEGTKSVMSKLSVDEETAGQIAECLMGSEDANNALLLIQKAWETREKALKIEYGKIPGPGAGGSNEDKETQAAIELAKELGKRKAQSDTSVRDQLKGLVR